MPDVAELERDCADAWPALADEPLGQWRLRAADGFTGRANSALTIGDPGRPVPSALAGIVEFARSHGIPPKAHVIMGTPVEDDLRRAGWRVDADHPGGTEAMVMTGPLAAGPAPTGVAVTERPPADWWPLAVGAPNPTMAQHHVLAGRAGLGFATARTGGEVTGIVRGAVIGDLLHIARLAVGSTHRRAGLATGLLAALSDWAAQCGARGCVLQVAVHNTAAVSLYAKLGCRPHHRYRFWVPGG